jgi:hypothetical protein
LICFLLAALTGGASSFEGVDTAMLSAIKKTFLINGVGTADPHHRYLPIYLVILC